MIFADLFFVYAFLPVFGILYGIAYAIEHKKDTAVIRNTVLILFSLLFYAWGEPVYIVLLLFCILLTYLCARWRWEIFGIVLNLLILAVFKYGNMVMSLFERAGIPLYWDSIRLPIGISFFTFQAISYLADVRKNRYLPEKNPFYLLLYISMFPQLIAGPIVRYSDIAGQIRQRDPKEQEIAEGIRRFVYGFGKKVLIADQLSKLVSQTMGGSLDSLTTGMAWLSLVAFSLQIYFDFSGYSDMAIGMGKCMGFRYPENFDHPYLCRSVTDFWRRWHKTLGTFFRDYVYIPMGGNRCSVPARMRNILMVWALTGFWHGASLNYLVWGVYFGLILMLEKLLYFRKDKQEKGGVTGLLRRFFSLFLVVCGWGIFYYEDFGKMVRFFRILFGADPVWPGQDILLQSALMQNAFLLGVSLILCLNLPSPKGRTATVLRTLVSAAILILGSILLVGETTHPFLYTRF